MIFQTENRAIYVIVLIIRYLFCVLEENKVFNTHVLQETPNHESDVYHTPTSAPDT